MTRTGILVIMLIGFWGVPGCRSVIDQQVGLPPLFETKTTGTSEEWAIRPIVGHYQDEHRDEWAGLWPIIFDQQRGQTSRSWLLPVWYQGNFDHDDGRQDSDGFILPFLFYGADTLEGAYFMFFPVAGLVKGLAGQDRISTLLFPLYARLVDADRSSTHVLFPFFNRVTGPRNPGWRLFPFFGHYQTYTASGKIKHDRRFYMWPFVQFQDLNLDTGRPFRARWYWPFYGVVDGDSFREQSWLWPLFTFRASKISTTRQWTITPLVRVSRGPTDDQTDIWPLFGVRRRGPTYYRQFALYPIQRYERWQAEGRTHTSSWLLPFYRNHHIVDDRTGEEKSRTHLWPLATWGTDNEGVSTLSALDPLPFLDTGGWFDRLWARYWRVYRQVSDPQQGRSAWEFLWGIVASESADQHSSFSVLGGLFGIEHEGEERSWRVLWIPF